MRMLPLLIAFGLCSAAVAAEQPSLPPPELDLAFSRYYAGAVAQVDARTTLVLRMDRDILALKVEVRPPPGVADAGQWEARLIPLPATPEPEDPNMRTAAASPATWRSADAVREGHPLETTVRARVPRTDYQNWLLCLDPREGAKPVEVAATATPIDYDARVQWLLAMRAQWQPQEQPDLTRLLISQLTDEEVRRWTGKRDRLTFDRVWLRMTQDQFHQAFPGPEEFDADSAGYTLPNGYVIDADGCLSPPRVPPHGPLPPPFRP